MSFWKDLLNPKSWLFWTYGGTGVRDGNRSLPPQASFGPIRSHPNTVVELRRNLLQKALKAQDNLPSSADSDLHETIALLRGLLARRGGSLDGLNETDLEALVEEMVQTIGEEASQKGAVIGPVVAERERIFITEAEERIGAVLQVWESKHHDLETVAGQHAESLLQLKEKALKLHEEHRKRGLREPYHAIPRSAYWLVVISVGIGEFVFNRQAFAILEVSPFDTNILALTVSFLVVGMAHAAGMMARALPGRQSRALDMGLLLGGVTTGLIAIFGLNYLRMAYLSHKATATALSSDELQMATLALTVINLLFFLLGTILSYLSHDADAELERLYYQKKSVEKRMIAVWKKHARAAASFDKLRGQCLVKIRTIQQDMIGNIAEYRHYNRHTNPSFPPSSELVLDINQIYEPVYLKRELDHTPTPIRELFHTIERKISTEYSTSITVAEKTSEHTAND